MTSAFVWSTRQQGSAGVPGFNPELVAAPLNLHLILSLTVLANRVKGSGKCIPSPTNEKAPRLQLRALLPGILNPFTPIPKQNQPDSSVCPLGWIRNRGTCWLGLAPRYFSSCVEVSGVTSCQPTILKLYFGSTVSALLVLRRTHAFGDMALFVCVLMRYCGY